MENGDILPYLNLQKLICMKKSILHSKVRNFSFDLDIGRRFSTLVSTLLVVLHDVYVNYRTMYISFTSSE